MRCSNWQDPTLPLLTWLLQRRAPPRVSRQELTRATQAKPRKWARLPSASEKGDLDDSLGLTPITETGVTGIARHRPSSNQCHPKDPGIGCVPLQSRELLARVRAALRHAAEPNV